MKILLLIVALAFVENGFCKCPDCPKKEIKKEDVKSVKPVKKQAIERNKVPRGIKRKVIREKPPIASVKKPYKSPIY